MESGFVTPKPDSLSVSVSLCVSRSPHTTLLNSTTTDHLIIQKLSFVNVIIICFSKSPYTEEIYQSISTLSHSDTPGHGLWVGSFCNSVNSPYFTVAYMHACVYICVRAYMCACWQPPSPLYRCDHSCPLSPQQRPIKQRCFTGQAADRQPHFHKHADQFKTERGRQ